MPEDPLHKITYSVSADSFDGLRTRFVEDAANIFGLHVSDTGPPTIGHDGHDPDPPAQQTRRRRSRDAANGAAEPPPEPEVEHRETVNTGELRTKAVDILKQCFGMPPNGAEKVVDLQKAYDVKRFAEVPDAKVQALYKDANTLLAELSGGQKAAPAADTGPFFFSSSMFH